MSVNAKQFGQQIQKARKLKQWTTSDLAEAVHYTSKSIILAENGQVDLSLEFLLTLCQALEVTPNDLLEGQFAPAKRSLEEQTLINTLREMIEEEPPPQEPNSNSTRIQNTEETLLKIYQMVTLERAASKASEAAKTPKKSSQW